MDKRDIHNRERSLNAALKKLNKSAILEQNKKLILSFKEECVAQGLSTDRVLFYLDKLRMMAEGLKKEYNKLDKEDIKDIVLFIEKKDISPWTKQGYKVALKKFYKWLNGGLGYPSIVSWVNTNVKQSSKVLPTNLISKDEIMKMINRAKYFRDKAIIMTLYESGFRIGELLNMKIGDLEFTNYGVKINVMGKTGSRRVLLISSMPYISNWIANHPDRNNPDAYVWTTLRYTKKWGKELNYHAVKKMISLIANDCGVTKKINPHSFRHARATELANKLTEAQMNMYFGWVQGSNMPATYVHLSGRDVDNAIMGIHGLVKEDRKEEEFNTKLCPRCELMNPHNIDMCRRCGMILDEKKAIEAEGKDKEVLKMLSNPEILSKLLSLVKEKVQ
ncbi:MAG: tyrosine-type recombinase/integrase [Candidatus Nanoarchaeia archaeon]|nr:tyrosine-type recombinase/integrase [Candidatus Nanoarchaeia archaeon]